MGEIRLSSLDGITAVVGSVGSRARTRLHGSINTVLE